MAEELKKKTRRFGFFWYLLITAISFVIIAPLRVSSSDNTLPEALTYSALCSLGIISALLSLLWIVRWILRNRLRFLLLIMVVALVSCWTINLPYEFRYDATFELKLLIAWARASFVVLLLAAAFCFMRWLCKGRRLWIFLGLLGGFVLLVIAFYAEENWRGNRAWNNYRREWEAKGEKFEFMSYVPPPVPDDQNFALAPIVASCYQQRLASPSDFEGMHETNNRLHMQLERTNSESWSFYPTNSGSWQRGRLVDLSAFQTYYRATVLTNENSEHTNIVSLPLDFPIASEPQSPATDVLLALSRYGPVIEELRAASRLPYSRFPLHYDIENPSMLLLPHLANLKACVQVLQLQAVAELQSGQSDQALADVKLMLRLIDSIKTEPVLLSQLVRTLLLKLTLQPVWEGLVNHRWSEPQLVALQDELGKLDFISDADFVLRSGWAATIKTLEFARTHPDLEDSAGGVLVLAISPRFIGWFGENTPEWIVDFLSPMLSQKALEQLVKNLPPNGWYQQNKVSLSEFYRLGVLPVVDTQKSEVPLGAISNANSTLNLDRNPMTPYNCLVGFLAAGLPRSIIKFVQAQGSADLARVACALERNRLAKGEYPETLEEVAPQFIHVTPHDVIHGEPLKYHRTGDGQYVLYSIGWDEKDDGGAAGDKFGGVILEHGDWVWWSSPNMVTSGPPATAVN